MKVLRHEEEIERLGATVVAVVHDEPEHIRSMLLRGLAWPYPVGVDLERRAYRDWGCRRASVARIWLDPRVWLRTLLAAVRAGRPRGRGADTLQLGGDFVVDPEGRIAYARPQAHDDRPPVRVLLKALAGAVTQAGFRNT